MSMRVKIEFTIELDDPADWTLWSGIEGAKNIRADVKDYVINGIEGFGVFGNGEVTARVIR